jgi:hypothetical protein
MGKRNALISNLESHQQLLRSERAQGIIISVAAVPCYRDAGTESRSASPQLS